jgi:predicted transcriptional regulator
MGNKGLQVTIKLSPEVKRRLRIVAAEQDTNMSVIAGNLIKAGLETYKKQHGISKEPPNDAA